MQIQELGVETTTALTNKFTLRDDDKRKRNSLYVSVPNFLRNQSIDIRPVRTRLLSSEAHSHVETKLGIACGIAMTVSSALAPPSTACMSLGNNRKCRRGYLRRTLRRGLGWLDAAKAAEGSNEAWDTDF